jgi:ribose transport system substrate-binding protein
MLKSKPTRKNRWIHAGGVGAALVVTAATLGGLVATASGGQANVAAKDPLKQFLPCNAKGNVNATENDLLNYKVPKAKEPYDITIMTVTLAGHYYQGLAYGATKAAKIAGVKLRILSPGTGYADPAQQVSQAENAIQAGTDAIVLQPVDIQGSVPVVTAAAAKKIPVINISTEADHSSPVTSFVMQDDYLMGVRSADEVHRLLPQGGEGIILAGPANATWSRKRANGFQDRVKQKYPNLKVVAAPTQNVDPTLGLKSFDNATQAHPNIKFIYSVFNFLLQPNALPAQYKGKVVFVTNGYDWTTIPALKDGLFKSVLGITPVWMGYLGLAEAVAVLNGQKAPKWYCVPMPAITENRINSPIAKWELVPKGFTAKSG